MSEPKRHNLHEEDGTFAKTISDDELWALYEEFGTTGKVAKACGLAPRSIRQRLVKIRQAKGIIVEQANVDIAGAFEKMVASVPREIPGGGQLTSIDTGMWEVAAKDDLSQQLIKRGLDKIGAKYSFGGKQPLDIMPFKNPLRPYKTIEPKNTAVERIFIIGDIQAGFWCSMDENDSKKFHFIPFHDLRAIDVMIQAIAMFKPDRIVIVGDFFDFPQLSRFQQEPEWGQTMQATIDYGYDLIGLIRATAGNECKIDFIPGNHETRMQRAIVNGNPSLMNLRKPGHKYSIYSIPGLMDFEERGIECASEFPSGEVWLAPRKGQYPGLVVTHADPKRREMRADSIHGHLVMPGKYTASTIWEQDGPVTFERMCVSGCGNYSDTTDGRRLTRTNTASGTSRSNYANSFGWVEIDKKTGLRHMDYVKIIDGSARFMDRTIVAKV